MGFQLPTSTGDCRIPSINRMSTEVQLKMRWNGVPFCGRTHLFKKTVSFIGSFGLQRTESHPCPHIFFWCVLFCSSLYSGEDEWTMEQKYWYGRGGAPFGQRKVRQNRDFAVSLKDNNSMFSVVILPTSLFSLVIYHRPLTCQWDSIFPPKFLSKPEVMLNASSISCWRFTRRRLDATNFEKQQLDIKSFQFWALQVVWFEMHMIFFNMKIVKSIQILWKNRCIQSTGIFLMVHEQIQRTSWDA